MSGPSTIEWTDATWNPVTGCSKVSPGCANCYAEGIARRFAGRAGNPEWKPWTPGNAEHNVVLHTNRLEVPLRWRKPRMVFVNSMSDLFHPQVPDDFIDRVFAVMALADHHTFQVLTKRPERMRIYLTARDGWTGARERVAIVAEEIARRRGENVDQWWDLWLEQWPLTNVWLGTSIENDRHAYRADFLRATPAARRFISAEPLLGPLPSLCLQGIDWLIVGGESGPGARPMHPWWPRTLRDQCLRDGVAFFFKQWGTWAPGSLSEDGSRAAPRAVAYDGRHAPLDDIEAMRGIASDHRDHMPRFAAVHRAGKTAAGRELDGRTWNEIPPTAATA